MENFIYETMLDDVTVCDELIEYYENNTEQKTKGTTAGGPDINNQGKVSTDVVIQYSRHPAIQKYVRELTLNGIRPYSEKYGLNHSHKMGLKEPFNIQHYAPNEGYRMWHCERSTSQSLQRALAWMTYLNDVDDGGETEFHWQQLKVKPVKGKTLVWPTDFTHLHRGITSPTQHKYIITGWFNFHDAIDMEREYMTFIDKSKELSETYKMVTGRT